MDIFQFEVEVASDWFLHSVHESAFEFVEGQISLDQEHFWFTWANSAETNLIKLCFGVMKDYVNTIFEDPGMQPTLGIDNKFPKFDPANPIIADLSGESWQHFGGFAEFDERELFAEALIVGTFQIKIPGSSVYEAAHALIQWLPKVYFLQINGDFEAIAHFGIKSTDTSGHVEVFKPLISVEPAICQNCLFLMNTGMKYCSQCGKAK